jgi:flagellar protein FlaG
MKVNAIPFELGFAPERATASMDPLARTSPPVELVKPVPVELDHGHDSTKDPVRPVVNGLGMELEFSVDKDAKVTIIKVVDSETGEVVRQIPPEELVALMRQFDGKGLFVSRRL